MLIRLSNYSLLSYSDIALVELLGFLNTIGQYVCLALKDSLTSY